jgi:hypothetical protein
MPRQRARVVAGEFRLIAMREVPNEQMVELDFVPDSVREPVLKDILYKKPEFRGMWVCFVPKEIADHLRLQSYYTIELKLRK